MTKHSLFLLVFGHQARPPVKFEIWPDELCSEDESTAENAVLGYTTDFDESDLDGGTVYSAPLSTHSQCFRQKFVSKGGWLLDSVFIHARCIVIIMIVYYDC